MRVGFRMAGGGVGRTVLLVVFSTAAGAADVRLIEAIRSGEPRGRARPCSRAAPT